MKQAPTRRRLWGLAAFLVARACVDTERGNAFRGKLRRHESAARLTASRFQACASSPRNPIVNLRLDALKTRRTGSSRSSSPSHTCRKPHHEKFEMPNVRMGDTAGLTASYNYTS